MVATSQIAQTTLRSVLGQHLLDELLSERDKINAILQQIIDEATSPWGIKVSIVEVKDVEIPAGMQRAMARQAEAERERRAKVINAEGEFQASERLKRRGGGDGRAQPIALQLRYLQTLLEIGSANASTIVFPAPIDLHPAVPRAAEPRCERTRRRLIRLTTDVATDVRRDPLSGRLRRDRPWAGRRPGAGLASSRRRTRRARACPFCAGREDQTPPETLLAPIGDAGWRSASCRTSTRPSSAHEVVVHAPRHVRSLAELGDGELGARRRGLAAARGAERAGLRPASSTRAADAGSSLPHTHSQLVWLDEPPPEVAREQRRCAGDCPLCGGRQRRSSSRSGTASSLSRGLGGPAPVRAADRAPLEHEADAWSSPALAVALQLVADEPCAGCTHVEGAAAAQRSGSTTAGHWHLELVPRLTVLAGLELGAGSASTRCRPRRRPSGSRRRRCSCRVS